MREHLQYQQTSQSNFPTKIAITFPSFLKQGRKLSLPLKTLSRVL
jgi:hypothetical protein